ncbi:MAG: D-alanyl-D-alanine carboxypeptidase [Ruminococcus sp.]|nr:D-alanyl-D-alanine carboxypeptidase [Ruminococcus sp.]
MNGIFKAVLSFVLTAAVILLGADFAVPTEADGITGPAAASVSAEAETVPYDFGECRAAALYECSSGTLIASKNAEAAIPVGQLTKLMTALIAAEKLESGELTPNETVTASKNAFDQQGSQIWLGIGEKISVEELLLSITVGNANDAAVALAEHISGSAEEFSALMNSEASRLGMKNTRFDDCAGLSSKNAVSAEDMALLCCELVKCDSLIPYFSQRLAYVRGGRAELVSRNELIRSYPGTRGFKVCYTEESGYCAALCAEKADMTLCLVILGAENEDALIARCKAVFDRAAAENELYTPELPEDLPDSIAVTHGQKYECSVEVRRLRQVIIPRGTYRSVTCEYELISETEAPVKAGMRVGTVRFLSGDKEISSAEIVTGEEIPETDFGFSFKRVLFNLLNI